MPQNMNYDQALPPSALADKFSLNPQHLVQAAAIPPAVPSKLAEGSMMHKILYGEVEAVSLPHDWNVFPSVDCTSWIFVADHRDHVSITLRLCSLITHQAPLFFSKLNQAISNVRPRVLFPSEIRLLSPGLSRVGFNQYSSPEKYMFFLSSAVVSKVNDKALLEIEGSHVDAKQKHVSDLHSYYWLTASGEQLQVLSVEGERSDVWRMRIPLRKMLGSIQWKQRAD